MTDRTQDDDALRTLLATPRRIAVVGASDKPHRESHGVFRFLLDQGHDAVPVNPTVDAVAGVPAVASLAEATEHWGKPPEIVDVFRRPEHLGAVVEAAIEVEATWVWMQLGVIEPGAIARADGAGLDYVVDRCIKIESVRLSQ